MRRLSWYDRRRLSMLNFLIWLIDRRIASCQRKIHHLRMKATFATSEEVLHLHGEHLDYHEGKLSEWQQRLTELRATRDAFKQGTIR